MKWMAFCSIHGEDNGVLIFILSAYVVLSLNEGFDAKKRNPFLSQPDHWRTTKILLKTCQMYSFPEAFTMLANLFLLGQNIDVMSQGECLLHVYTAHFLQSLKTICIWFKNH